MSPRTQGVLSIISLIISFFFILCWAGFINVTRRTTSTLTEMNDKLDQIIAVVGGA